MVGERGSGERERVTGEREECVGEGGWVERGGMVDGGRDYGSMDVLLTLHLLGIQALLSLRFAELVSGLYLA